MKNLTCDINKRNMVLGITFECNLKCKNCNCWCSLAPTANNNSRMTIEQVIRFTEEMLEYKHFFNMIKFSGGEPLLHPNLFQMLEIVKPLQEKNICKYIVVMTNGILKEKIAEIPKWVTVINSEKDKYPVNHWVTCGKPPIELNKLIDSNNNNCFMIQNGDCSIFLTKWGYYLNGTCGSLDRFIGVDAGVKTFKEIIESDFKILEDQQDKLCQYCGFSYASLNTDCTQSQFYKNIIEKYDRGEIKLTQYN